jgi:hypothetical protein
MQSMSIVASRLTECDSSRTQNKSLWLLVEPFKNRRLKNNNNRGFAHKRLYGPLKWLFFDQQQLPFRRAIACRNGNRKIELKTSKKIFKLFLIFSIKGVF